MINIEYSKVKKSLLFIVLLCVLSSHNSYASGNYHVEAIVFSQGAGEVYGNAFPDDAPDFGKSWGMKTAYLNDYARKLRSSGNYPIIRHLAWGVRSKPYSKSAAHIVDGAALNGWVKVFAKSLLFAHIDLVHNGTRIKEKRRLKLNEVHYFDNESFGLLLRVSRSET